jgi:hypothetical protein
LSLRRILGLEDRDLPFRLGEGYVDERPIRSSLKLRNPGRSYTSTPIVRINGLVKGILLLLGLFLVLPGIFLALAISFVDPFFAGAVLDLVVIVVLGVFIYLGIRILGLPGGTYLVTTWRALVLNGNNEVIQECYLKYAVPVSAPYTIVHGTAGSHSKGDVDFHSSTDASFLMKFADIDYPEELEKKIKIAQGTRLALCKSCGLPMSSASANYCGACGTKQT